LFCIVGVCYICNTISQTRNKAMPKMAHIQGFYIKN
jgi:hypothetical protein